MNEQLFAAAVPLLGRSTLLHMPGDIDRVDDQPGDLTDYAMARGDVQDELAMLGRSLECVGD
jgi:hypothetical protein